MSWTATLCALQYSRIRTDAFSIHPDDVKFSGPRAILPTSYAIRKGLGGWKSTTADTLSSLNITFGRP